jgi:hypothetical protein
MLRRTVSVSAHNGNGGNRYRISGRDRTQRRQPDGGGRRQYVERAMLTTASSRRLRCDSRTIREQKRPSRTQTRVGPGTRKQDQPSGKGTSRNLQNLHPRFKSGRRLQKSLGNSPDWVCACVRGRFLIAPKRPRMCSSLRRGTPVNHCLATSCQRAISAGGGSQNLHPRARKARSRA